MKRFGIIFPILLILLTGCADSAQPYNIHLNCTADPAYSMEIVWQADTDYTKQSLYISPADDLDNEREILALGTKEDGVSFFNAKIDGLQPDTQYNYRIGEFQGGFKTAAEQGGFTFLFLGDPQPDTSLDLSIEEQYTVWGNLLEQSAQIADFVLLSGDLVNDSSELNEWNLFFEAGKNVFSVKPFAAAMGNHDKSGYYRLMMSYPSYPNAPERMEDEYYSFDYQNTHFCIINSNNIIDESAIKWLAADLDNDADFNIVMMHHSPYSASNSVRDEERAKNLRDRFENIFLQNEVDIVLVGHEHLYMRSKPMANEKNNEENGIIYLMGVSGAKSYSSGENDYSDCLILGEQVYSHFTVDESNIFVQTFSISGEVLDSFSITAE